MILKLDHVSLSLSRDEDQRKWLPQDYELSFEELAIPNIASKTEFLIHDNADHDLLMYANEAAGSFPIEVTKYDQVSGSGPIDAIESDFLILKVRDVEQTVRFLGKFGFKESAEDETIMEGRFPLDSGILRFRIERSESVCWHLDTTGYSSLALIVSNLKRAWGGVLESGFFASPPSSLLVNGKLMNVAFARPSAENMDSVIVELIEVHG